MNSAMLTAIIHNAALLLALGALYAMFPFRPTVPRLRQRLIAGCIIGLIGIAVMLTRWRMADGIIFDVRTILLAVAGLFFGVIPTVIAVIITAGYRILVGGAGLMMGLTTIISAAGLGLLWRYKRPSTSRTITWVEFYLFGLVVHLVMMVCMVLIPQSQMLSVLRAMSVPVLLIYPLGTVLLCMLLKRQQERQEIEASLTESEARYRSLFENNHAIMFLIDPHTGMIVDANPAAVAYYGWTRDTLLGMRADQINTLPPQLLFAELEQARTEQRNYFIFQHRRADGSLRDVEVYCGPIRMHGQALLYSVVHDITDRRVAEETLTRKTEELDRYFTHALDLLCIADTDGYFRRVNKEWENTLGYTSDALQGQRFLDFVHPDDLASTLETLSRLRGQTAVMNFVNRYRHRDGSYRWIEWRSFPEGNLIYACARDITEHRKVEDALRESEQQFRTLANSGQSLIWTSGCDKRCDYFNEPWLRFTGRTLEQELGDGWAEGVHPDDFDRCLRTYTTAFDRREPFRMDYRMRHASGDYRWIADEGSPRYDSNGHFLGYIGNCYDITERRQVEDALRESEERYTALFERSLDAVFLHDFHGRFLDANDRALSLIGYTREDLPSITFATLLDEDQLRFAFPAMRGVIETGTQREIITFRVKRRDGTAIWVEMLASLIYKDGVPSAIQGVARDITERIRAEEALRESQALLNEAGHIANIGGWVLDIDTGTQEWTAQVYCIHEVEMTFQPTLSNGVDFYAPDSRPIIAQAVERAMTHGEAFDLELEFITAKGHARWVHAVGKADLEHRKVFGTFQDITERKKAEEEQRLLELQIQQTQKLESLGVLAGGIAHDFNNILMAVLGYAELSLIQLSPLSPARDCISKIVTATHRAAELSRQMLAYSGKASFAMERMSLGELVEEMTHLLKTSVSKKALLNLHVERDLPLMQADPSQIRQIVMNLIINASDAVGDRSGVITIAVGATRCDEAYLRATELHDSLQPGLYLHLEVTDTGCGMNAETRARIFEPFFTTKFTGRGLGLAAVLGIVRAHKGALKVYSEPGTGTTFKILFPALGVEGDIAPKTQAGVLANWQNTGTILFADDEESIRAVGAGMLELLGYTVLTAADGREAVELYQQHGEIIDLVVLDMTMPHMDGAEAFRELRRLNPDVRVLLASGYSKEDIGARFAGKGIAGVLQKPFTLDLLRETLGNVFAVDEASSSPTIADKITGSLG